MAAAQQKAEAAKAKSEPVKPEAKPEPVKTEAAKPAEPVKAEAAPEAKLAPKPAPKPVVPPPPPPEPELMDTVMENLPIIGGGLGVLVLGGLGFAAMRRRRARSKDNDDIEPVMPAMAAAAATAAAADEPAEATGVAGPAVDDVDPLAEAEVYIAYGRDGQAEEILKEAMARDPVREDVQVKLAEVYAARKDATSFGDVAASINALTGGAGDNWLKVAALGYALDPANPLYEAGKGMAPVETGNDAALGTDLDFDLGGDVAATPDIALDADSAVQATELAGMQEMAAAADAGVPPSESSGLMMPDFNLDAPAPAAASNEPASIDFNIDLPPLDMPAPEAPAQAPAAPAADAGLDFKIDVGDLNINLDDTSTQAAPSSAAKDGHWYDVQQKFDLAKAYQEMDDNDGAREILQEVIKEGDPEQQDQAQKLLNSLG